MLMHIVAEQRHPSLCTDGEVAQPAVEINQDPLEYSGADESTENAQGRQQ